MAHARRPAEDRPDGTKRFNKGMAKEGAACLLGQPPPMATRSWCARASPRGSRSARRRCESLPVYLAFDAGNLKPVAERLRARYPLSPIIFCADDDWKTKRPTARPWNPGVEYAQAAARSVGYAWVVRPLFEQDSRVREVTVDRLQRPAHDKRHRRPCASSSTCSASCPRRRRSCAKGQTLAISAGGPRDRGAARGNPRVARGSCEDGGAGGSGGGNGSPPDGRLGYPFRA
jgi:hypothetical protein